MNGFTNLEPDYSEFVEVDPTGRYGRYNEILGKGASKTVYRAFDEYEGIEVAWNQVKLHDFLQSPEDLERLYCEIHLLKTLKHPSIMKFYTSWVDTANRNINFVTEMFTSGTLKQYRQKHKRVNIRAVKHWCRQILSGLLYLHSHDPPVIHRDLKCDNIFVNGNQGEVKIGDLGLAAMLRKSHAAHCVGTPEFMAPEVYAEEYNELVDIYSFGMCILEMVTFEYPYSECTHPAQIYKKVTSGKKPDALYTVKDPEVREFVEKCLATVSLRLSARELLNDPFLQNDDCEFGLRPIDCQRETDCIDLQPYLELDCVGKTYSNSSFIGYLNGIPFEGQIGWEHHSTEIEQSGIELFEYNDEEHEDHHAHLDITIKGKRREDDSIFLRLRISDTEGHIRNIYFPFDIESDTALSVATEMVAELDITDQDVTKIADMIDGEIGSLVPDWKPGPGIEETPKVANSLFCRNCASNLQILQCSGNGCAAMHGRFEEIWDRHGSLEFSSLGSGESHSEEQNENSDQPTAKEEREREMDHNVASSGTNSFKSLPSSHSFTAIPSLSHGLSDDYEHEIQQELRWLKAKYQIELRKLRDKHLGLVPKPPRLHSSSGVSKHKILDVISSSSDLNHLQGKIIAKSSSIDKHCGSNLNGLVENCFHNEDDSIVAANRLYTGSLIPNTLHRTTSLPVDAIDL